MPIFYRGFCLHSDKSEEILMMVSAHESRLGKYLKQIGGGPALGICQVEPRTMVDNYVSFLDKSSARKALKGDIARVCGVLQPNEFHLQYNHLFNFLMARVKFLRSSEPLPDAHNIPGMAKMCKEIFNATGAATVEDYILDYQSLVLS
jgi:hypothetical protein